MRFRLRKFIDEKVGASGETCISPGATNVEAFVAPEKETEVNRLLEFLEELVQELCPFLDLQVPDQTAERRRSQEGTKLMTYLLLLLGVQLFEENIADMLRPLL